MVVFSDSEQIIVILNNQDQERDIRVTAWKTGVSRKEATAFQRLMLSSGEGYTEMPEEYIADAGILQVKMPAYGAMVLHHRARDKYNDARVRQRKKPICSSIRKQIGFLHCVL